MGDDLQITVIATGFTAMAKRQYGGGIAGNVLMAPGRKTIDFPVQRFDQDDLDIPAFLRKRN